MQFVADDRALYNWLTALEETGFALLSSVPTEPGQLHRIAARVAYLRKTLLGYGRWSERFEELTVEPRLYELN